MLKATHTAGLRLIGLATLLACTQAMADDALFDAHLHYNAEHAAELKPQAIIAILRRNQVRKALVTATPAGHAEKLYRQAPDRILPVLGVYTRLEDKQTWVNDKTLPARIEAQLQQGTWCAIGELHIFAEDRLSPVFLRIIELAQRHRLPLLLHSDPAVIDTVYEQAPDQPVIWAHAGTYPYPDLIADYLQRYPALRVDLSVRDERIAPGGTLRDDWYELFLRYPDRFLVGVDTYSLARWQNFDEVVNRIRRWLKQLPDEVAAKLAYGNAAKLFAMNDDRATP